MAVNKLDITMMEDVGTSANQLVQRDGSGNLPVVDGSQLTDIDPGFTVSTSDPVVTTNPSGGVGSLWYNKIDGEMFVCTDATAGENVWINVGGGTGNIISWNFHASTYGYGVGGGSNATSNVIDRFSIPSGGTATDHGDLYEVSLYPGCYNTTTYGYVHTSMGPPAGTWPWDATVQKFAFASNTTGTAHCSLSVARGWVATSYNETHGYSAGGRQDGTGPHNNEIDKFAFDSTSTAVDWGDIGDNIYSLGGSSSATHGYHSSGYKNPSGQPVVYTQAIYKYPFASNAGSAGHGNLTNVGRNGGSGVSDQSGGYGFHIGGNAGGNGYRTDIDKFAFSSNTTASDHGDLSGSGRYGMGGISGASHGYNVAGYDGPNSPSGHAQIIDKFAYASNTTATDIGDLSVARSSNGANGY